MNNLIFPSLTSLNKWSGNITKYLGEIPYVFKDGLYWYFTLKGKDYQLSMTSLNDLGEMK